MDTKLDYEFRYHALTWVTAAIFILWIMTIVGATAIYDMQSEHLIRCEELLK